MERLNIEALATLTTRDNVQLRTFPPDFVAAARAQATDVLRELAGNSGAARKVHDSYAVEAVGGSPLVHDYNQQMPMRFAAIIPLKVWGHWQL